MLKALKTIAGVIPFLKNLHVPPGHYYSPIISVDELTKRKNSLWSEPSRELSGIRLNEDGQLELLQKFKVHYHQLPFSDKPKAGRRYYFNNNMYSYSDGIFLFCMMREFKPKRIIEVGSGFSSALMLDVNSGFFENNMDLTFIEPFPARLESLLLPGESVNLIQKGVQDVDLGLFQELEENDFLFIDSSHILKTGSDLNFLLFEVLPRLNPGVKVHFHDIFYPFEYPENWVLREKRSWNEAYALRAFLSFNNQFQIIAYNTFLEEFHASWFKANMPLCMLNKGGSIWLNVEG